MMPNKLIIGIFVILFFNVPTFAQNQEFVISSQNAFLRDKPSFLGKSLGGATYGAKVNILKKNGDWCQIVLANKLGWVHKSALQDGYYILKEIGNKDGKSKKTYKDEVVAAGKGFSPEFESMMKSQNPEVKYDNVDKIEKWKISVESLIKFGVNGGLKSEVLK